MMNQLRWSNEDGQGAGARNWGRLALAIIPAALGGAACLWIAAAAGWVDLRKAVTAEDRAMRAVGLTQNPVAPIKFESFDAKCLKVDAAYMKDGTHFAFVVKNTCRDWLPHPAYAFRLLANGTTTESGDYAFSGDHQIGPTERREQVVWIEKGTARVDTIRVYAED
jgi:hypothetical protein